MKVMTRSHSPGELEDFFKEFEDIESNKEGEEDEEGSHCKTPDGKDRIYVCSISMYLQFATLYYSIYIYMYKPIMLLFLFGIIYN